LKVTTTKPAEVEKRNYQIVKEYIETGDPYDIIADRLNLKKGLVRKVLVEASLKGFEPRITGTTYGYEEPKFVEITSKVLIQGNKVVHLFPSTLNF
jgi:hypothetical protein